MNDDDNNFGLLFRFFRRNFELGVKIGNYDTFQGKFQPGDQKILKVHEILPQKKLSPFIITYGLANSCF